MKISLLLSLMLLEAAVAHADPLLKDVCGAEGNPIGGVNSQTATLCKGAYNNGNLWIVNDNNSRVRASIAVTCAYSCLAGGMGSCAGGGGGACGSAVDNGNKAYQYNNQSQDSYTAAQTSGSHALNLIQSTTSVVGQGQTPEQDSSSSGTASGLPAPCKAAATTGSVQDRIACAAATDPSLPAFVQDPQFLADFQQATGFPLQQAINESNESLMQNYIPTGIQHAMTSAGAKTSVSSFLSGGASLVAGVLGNLASSDEKSYLLSHILPQSLANLIPGVAYDPDSKRPGAKNPETATMLATGSSNPEVHRGAPAAEEASRGIAGISDEYGDLFVRVSAKYHAAFALGRVDVMDWALPMNRAMTEH